MAANGSRRNKTRKIPFVKYTACGNNFVIMDETAGKIMAESELAGFAYEATNIAFGVGCDNLLVIQRCNEDMLSAIAAQYCYWREPPDPEQAEFIFRMFEPTGEEAFCCGNGLMCIADYLSRRYNIEATTIMTEIPLDSPRVLSIGSSSQRMDSWVDIGEPRRTPPGMIQPGTTIPYRGAIDLIEPLSIEFRSHDLKPYSEDSILTLSGYLVFTGEPHLVVFPERSFSIPQLAHGIFGSSPSRGAYAGHADGRANFGSWLVHRIGSYINTRCLQIFPAGININFAYLRDSATVEYRCYERGINRETLASGTGALAVAYVTQQLFCAATRSFEVIPHRCRWHDPEARIQVEHTPSGWSLRSTPVLLFEGSYQRTATRFDHITDKRGHYADHYIPQSDIAHSIKPVVS
jgi:diaminopimelate epimerase